MWCWRRLEKNSWADRVKNADVLRKVMEEKRLSYTEKRTANWIGHILHRNCLLKHTIEGKIVGGIEVMIKRRRKRKQLLDDLREERICSKFTVEQLDCTLENWL